MTPEYINFWIIQFVTPFFERLTEIVELAKVAGILFFVFWFVSVVFIGGCLGFIGIQAMRIANRFEGVE